MQAKSNIDLWIFFASNIDSWIFFFKQKAILIYGFSLQEKAILIYLFSLLPQFLRDDLMHYCVRKSTCGKYAFRKYTYFIFRNIDLLILFSSAIPARQFNALFREEKK